jgi:hypothetical protein
LSAGLGNYPQLFEGNEAGLLITRPRYRARLLGYWRAYIRDGGTLNSRVERTASGALLSPGDLSEVPARRRLYDARARLRTHSPRSDPRLVDAKKDYAELLDFLIARGATLCLVSFPLSPDYHSALGELNPATRALREELLEFFRQQAKRVGARYVDDQAKISDRTAFRDIDHLNGTAALEHGATLEAECFDRTDDEIAADLETLNSVRAIAQTSAAEGFTVRSQTRN